MTRFAVLTILLMSLFCDTAQAGGAKTVWVNAYTRSDGTYVSGYWRSPPDSVGVGVIPVAGGSAYMLPQEAKKLKDLYTYYVNIYQDGNLIVRSGGASEGGFKEAVHETAEATVFDAQERLRSKLYEKGLGHQQVNSIVLSAFTADACQLQTAPVDRREAVVFHKYTMDCIIPVIPDPPPPPPDTKKK